MVSILVCPEELSYIIEGSQRILFFLTMFHLSFWSRKCPLINNLSYLTRPGPKPTLQTGICHKSKKYLTFKNSKSKISHILKLKIQNITEEQTRISISIFPNISSQHCSLCGITNILCKHNLKKFPFQCFQSPPNVTNSLVSIFGQGTCINKLQKLNDSMLILG